MSTIIVKHALENVWTSPSEDLQVIFKPAKLTKDFTKGPYFSLVWDNIQTPNNTDYFQYYLIIFFLYCHLLLMITKLMCLITRLLVGLFSIGY